ncbi:MAG: hypothetical protein ACOCRK_09690 [bacterium]
MNQVEKKIYDLVKKNPKFKNIIRDIYQRTLSFIPQKKKESKYKITEREGYFFGFHDKIPFSVDNKRLLAHKININNREVTKEDEVEIGYFYGDNYKKYKGLAKTESWNWQQGSMLQWLGQKNDIIFNYWDGKNNISRIIDCEGKVIKDLPSAIGAVSPEGNYALSYSFERLNIGMYGYGYVNENDINKTKKSPFNSGLKIIDIAKGLENFIFSIQEIRNIKSEDSMKGAYHFFTHCLFNPAGDRFFFLHRWYKKGERLYSRLISSDIGGTNINIFPTKGMVSHMSWLGNESIIAYCTTEKYGDAYHIFKDKSQMFQIIDKEQYKSDGHPQYSLKTKLIVTDTYPNRFRIQELSLYNLMKRDKKTIAKLYSPIRFKGIMRCDLHPRWDRKGEYLCFDSAHTGKRSLCTINLKEC